MLPFGIMSMTVLGGCTCKEDKPCTDVTDGCGDLNCRSTFNCKDCTSFLCLTVKPREHDLYCNPSFCD